MTQGEKQRLFADQHSGGQNTAASEDSDFDLTPKKEETKKSIVACDVTEKDLDDNFASHNKLLWCRLEYFSFMLNMDVGDRRWRPQTQKLASSL